MYNAEVQDCPPLVFLSKRGQTEQNILDLSKLIKGEKPLNFFHFDDIDVFKTCFFKSLFRYKYCESKDFEASLMDLSDRFPSGQDCYMFHIK